MARFNFKKGKYKQPFVHHSSYLKYCASEKGDYEYHSERGCSFLTECRILFVDLQS